jgi:hypothetical protein
MPTIILRLGYACAPRRRGEVVAALRVIDQIGAPTGWPAGRYLLVDTRGAGEPDLEVEYSFTSLAEMEQREARLREQLRASARDGGPDTTSWQSGLISPGTRRLLTVIDDPGTARTGKDSQRIARGAMRDASEGARPEDRLVRLAVETDVTRTAGDAIEGDPDDDEIEPDEEPMDIDPSSLIPEGSVPVPLPPEEQQARARSLVREVPGLRVGFGTGDGSALPERRPRAPRRDG